MSNLMSATILLTGASSQLGQALIARLNALDARVLAWSREPGAAVCSERVQWQQQDLARVAGPLPASTLVHLAPLWLLPALLEKGGLEAMRVVAISSCSVHAKAASPSAEERDVAARLLDAELRSAEIARRDGHALTILRPTMLYGLGRDATVAALQRFIRRWRWLPFPALEYGLRQPVHVDDVALAIMACLGSSQTIGRTYDLGGGERLRLDEMARRLFTDNGLRPRVVPVPRRVVAGVIHLRQLWRGDSQWNAALLDRARNDQVADIEPARNDFGYAPRAFDGRFSPPSEG